MYHPLIRENKTLVSTILFLIIFGFIQFLKPSFLYNSDGSIREFGVGYRNKTILPLWIISICLGIISYLIICYFIKYFY